MYHEKYTVNKQLMARSIERPPRHAHLLEGLQLASCLACCKVQHATDNDQPSQQASHRVRFGTHKPCKHLLRVSAFNGTRNVGRNARFIALGSWCQIMMMV